MSLTKQDIANALVKKTDLTQTQALVLTNQFFEQIIETLSKGEDVKLSSFGNFVIRKKSQRTGRNPKTGEEVITILGSLKLDSVLVGYRLMIRDKKLPALFVVRDLNLNGEVLKERLIFLMLNQMLSLY